MNANKSGREYEFYANAVDPEQVIVFCFRRREFYGCDRLMMWYEGRIDIVIGRYVDEWMREYKD